MSCALHSPGKGRELDLAARMGTFEFFSVVGIALTVVLFSGRVTFLLHYSHLPLPTLWFFLNGNYLRSSIRANKLPKVKTIETAFY